MKEISVRSGFVSLANFLDAYYVLYPKGTSPLSVAFIGTFLTGENDHWLLGSLDVRNDIFKVIRDKSWDLSNLPVSDPILFNHYNAYARRKNKKV